MLTYSPLVEERSLKSITNNWDFAAEDGHELLDFIVLQSAKTISR